MGSLNKITLHWTGGKYTPNETDKSHYHFLIDGDGKVVRGTHKPEDNINCKDGVYAAHCGGGNTGNIGVALCGMWSDGYPIKRIQVEAMCKLVAQLCYRYGIRITSNNVLTHAEFGKSHPSTTSYGKIDINMLPCLALYNTNVVGNELRKKINWYKERL